jgi:hypothetical protein
MQVKFSSGNMHFVAFPPAAAQREPADALQRAVAVQPPAWTVAADSYVAFLACRFTLLQHAPNANTTAPQWKEAEFTWPQHWAGSGGRFSLLRWLHKFQLPAAMARGQSFAGQACGGVVLSKKHYEHLQLVDFAATRMGFDRLVWARFSEATLPNNITAAINNAAASPSRSAGLQHLLKSTKMTGNSPLTRALAYDVKSRGAYCELQPDHVALVPVEVLMQPDAEHEGPHETGALRREVSQESRARTCADVLEGCHQFRLNPFAFHAAAHYCGNAL